MRHAVLICLTMILMVATADAQPRGTAVEAQAMVARAIALYDQIGAEQAFATMNRPDGGFRDRDLYISVVGPNGRVVVQAAEPERVGLDVLTITDAVGTPYGRYLVDRATPDGVWVDYLRRDPLTGDDEPKSSWAVRHDGHVFLCGFYKLD